MMIVRAMVGNCNLILSDPKGDPFENLPTKLKIHFTALVPYQMSQILNHQKSKAQLEKLDSIILGGGQISEALLQQILPLKPKFYHTYGMTETLTHVAIKKLNGNDRNKYFMALPEVRFEKDNDDCLMIHTPLWVAPLKTTDLVNLIDEKKFEWLGRKDQMINSGGYKINPDLLQIKIEKLLHSHNLPLNRFFLFSKDDNELGQKLCIAFEGTKPTVDLKNILSSQLYKYEVPKELFFIDNFEYTSLGKIDKIKTLEIAMRKTLKPIENDDVWHIQSDH